MIFKALHCRLQISGIVPGLIPWALIGEKWEESYPTTTTPINLAHMRAVTLSVSEDNTQASHLYVELTSISQEAYRELIMSPSVASRQTQQDG